MNPRHQEEPAPVWNGVRFCRYQPPFPPAITQGWGLLKLLVRDSLGIDSREGMGEGIPLGQEEPSLLCPTGSRQLLQSCRGQRDREAATRGYRQKSVRSSHSSHPIEHQLPQAGKEQTQNQHYRITERKPTPTWSGVSQTRSWTTTCGSAPRTRSASPSWTSAFLKRLDGAAAHS